MRCGVSTIWRGENGVPVCVECAVRFKIGEVIRHQDRIEWNPCQYPR